MQQDTMYPRIDEVMTTIDTWRRANADEYRVVSIRLVGDSIRHFSVTLVGPNTLIMNLEILPGYSVKGWYAGTAKITRIGDYEYNQDMEVYPPHLVTLMNAFPHRAIVSLDNEDYPFPEGHPVFGYAAIDDDRNIVGFIQHPRNTDPEEPDYTYNPMLPHATLVTDDAILENLTELESPRIREQWADDVKEWWA